MELFGAIILVVIAIICGTASRNRKQQKPDE